MKTIIQTHLYGALLTALVPLTACDGEEMELSADEDALEFRDADDFAAACTWRRESTSDENVQAYCRSDERIVSGGCRSSDRDAPVKISTPFEDGGFANLTSLVEDTDPSTGWSCGRDDDDGKVYAFALCCEF